MPATRFICPDGSTIPIEDCIRNCPFENRCMARPAIISLAKNVGDRGLNRFSVTELMRGTRESYLLKMYNYAVDPHKLLLAAEGTALHYYNEKNIQKENWLITEERFANDIASGQIDTYGYIFNNKELVICDYKLTSTYKIAKALGYGYTNITTTEQYKSGAKKGQFKTKKVWTDQNVKYRMDWAKQQNFYRILLEEQGYRVDGMYIQAYARDYSAASAAKTNITKSQYVIKLNKISDHWLKLWFREKQRRITEALANHKLPPLCTPKETWNGLKCERYCDVAEICKQFQEQQQQTKSVA